MRCQISLAPQNLVSSFQERYVINEITLKHRFRPKRR